MNCPFDVKYEHILQAILFCLVRFGLKPRIATDRSDAGEARLDKILQLIESSRYSIHDLSRCQASERGEHYRLNMPFELGMDFACRRYGSGLLSTKVILILEEKRYRYQKAISDLAGSDIEAHGGKYETAVRKVRNWLTELPREFRRPVSLSYSDLQYMSISSQYIFSNWAGGTLQMGSSR